MTINPWSSFDAGGAEIPVNNPRRVTVVTLGVLSNQAKPSGRAELVRHFATDNR